MRRLVVGRTPALVVAHQVPATLRTLEDATDRLLDVMHGDLAAQVTDGEQGGLVRDVREVGAGEARGAVGDVLPVDVGREWLALGVDAQDALASLAIGTLDGDVPVEPAGAPKRRVEDVGPVGRTDHDDAAGDVEAVHLDQQLVEGLLALVRSAGRAAATTLAAG